MFLNFLPKNFLLSVGFVSLFSNALMLAGPLYMLQIYDRVLTSRSEQTLLALTLLIAAIYAIMLMLDTLRSSMMARIAAKFDTDTSPKLFNVLAAFAHLGSDKTKNSDPVRDLDNYRGFVSGPGALGLFDAPWLPVYLAVVFLFHTWLGILATVGALILMMIVLATELVTRQPAREAAGQIADRASFASALRRNSEDVVAMGLKKGLAGLWQQKSTALNQAQVLSGDRVGFFSSTTKTFRLLLQSSVLGLGAYLAIGDQITPGVMIAASIITARALAPIEQLVSHWRGLVTARQSKERLDAVLAVHGEEDPTTELPLPSGQLVVKGLVSGPSTSTPLISIDGFSLKAGDGVGVIGPSGSGKTSLARALLGIWPSTPGSVRLDGATHDQWDPTRLGDALGYLPQNIQFFDGTIAQNIARFTPGYSDQDVIEAAKNAGAHTMIAGLSDGYDTMIGDLYQPLSAGERQRVGLARALFKMPFLIILDEPNANLDAEGDQSLSQAIALARSKGSIVVVVAHRPSALAAVNLALVMKNGRQIDYGDKTDVIGRMTKNAEALRASAGLRVVEDGA